MAFEYFEPIKKIDMHTGLLWACNQSKYDVDQNGTIDETLTFETPLLQAVAIMDEQKNRAKVDGESGALYVQETGGIPQVGTVTTAADTWTTVLATARRCTHLWAYGITKNLSLSISGGPMIHFIIVAAGPPISVEGLEIPAGSVIAVQTRVAGENGTAYITVW